MSIILARPDLCPQKIDSGKLPLLVILNTESLLWAESSWIKSFVSYIKSLTHPYLVPGHCRVACLKPKLKKANDSLFLPLSRYWTKPILHPNVSWSQKSYDSYTITAIRFFWCWIKRTVAFIHHEISPIWIRLHSPICVGDWGSRRRHMVELNNTISIPCCYRINCRNPCARKSWTLIVTCIDYLRGSFIDRKTRIKKKREKNAMEGVSQIQATPRVSTLSKEPRFSSLNWRERRVSRWLDVRSTVILTSDWRDLESK